MKPIETDVLIIGAGPAGAIAAAALKRDGFNPLVVEKQRFPRFVIGESLLPRTMDLLQEVGLMEAVKARGYMVKHGAVFMRGEETCNFDFANQFSFGWKYTYQVPRADFDKVVADAVQAQGVEILYGHGVSAVNFVNSHVEVKIDQPDGSSRDVSARFILDCSGYGRVLPRLLDLERPSNFPVREALFAHVTGDVRPPEREQGKIWVCLHPNDAWIWIIPFSNGKTSIGVVAKPEFFQRFSGDPETQFRAILMSDPNAAARLSHIQLAFPPQRISGYACSVKQLFGPHYALTGNATEFLDPIFSSGVTLAMESSRRAAQLVARELRGETINWQADYTEYVMQGVNTFRAYVSAWYEAVLPTIFFSTRRSPEIMRQICSVLAGYVWDKSNPYVAQPERALAVLSKLTVGGPRPTAN
jgi:2-polyprenyl-6-methoxyphenol hydroxylase-like FAD-dependent oxidoreductase